MAIPGGFGGQTTAVTGFWKNGSIATGGTPQLILPARKVQPQSNASTRSYFVFQNTSAANLYLDFGPARATATVALGVVTTVSVTNAGFGYTYPPLVVFEGGCAPVGFLAGGMNFEPPAVFGGTDAVAHATLTGPTISSITVDYGGRGYTGTPDIYLMNDPRDPFGAAVPSTTSMELLPGGSFTMESSAVLTDAVAVYGATTAQTFYWGYST